MVTITVTFDEPSICLYFIILICPYFQDVLHGDSNTYTILCKAFKTYVLDQPESEQTERFDQTDMIQVNIVSLVEIVL